MQSTIPLAERLRPTSLDDYIGQKHIIGENAVLRRAIETGRVPSMIFLGTARRGQDHLGLHHLQAGEAAVFPAECGQ